MTNTNKITFLGAAGEVTGSRHLLETEHGKILLDCGMFQGHRHEAAEKNKSFSFRPADLDEVILTHAHIDHCGLMPLLAKHGLTATIHCSTATAELASIMLLDSARLQKSDAEFFNKIHAAENLRIEPLYSEQDARLALAKLQSHTQNSPFALCNQSVEAKLLNAGHVLGSSMAELTLNISGNRRKILYTGDLGRRSSMLMAAPQSPKDIDYLIIETTYGDRLHEDPGNAQTRLETLINRAITDKSKIIIPSFALERTQEIIFLLDRLNNAGKLKNIPVFVDSPMAINITGLFNKHREDFYFNDEFRSYSKNDKDPFGFDYINYVHTKEESQALNEKDGPMIIISASGMCEGGRILHHLRNNIGNEKAVILIVGYQAQGTLGRRLRDGANRVKIFGMEHAVAARVEVMPFFSAHADRDDLLAFIKGLNKAPKQIFLVHGENDSRAAFAQTLREAGFTNIISPDPGQTADL